MRIKTNVFILIILLLFFIFVNIFNVTTSMAALEKLPDVGVDINRYDDKSTSIDGTNINLNNYRPTGETSDNVSKIVNSVLGIITTVGVVLSVIIIAIIGFNYVIGSASEKAISKEQLGTFLIGAVLLFAGSIIVKVIYNQVINWL